MKVEAVTLESQIFCSFYHPYRETSEGDIAYAKWLLMRENHVIMACDKHLYEAFDYHIAIIRDRLRSSSDITDTKEFITDYNKYLDSNLKEKDNIIKD